MTRTQITGQQVKNSSVQRDDLDSVTVGQAVTKKLIAGSNVTFSSTGVDAGTGDVTINAVLSGTGSQLSQLSDVSIDGLQNGSMLVWDSTLNKFKFVLPSSGSSTPEEEMPYAKRVDFVNDNELYKGEAAVGSLPATSVWRICKIVISNDGDVSETWADGNSNYDNSWVDRLTYTYS